MFGVGISELPWKLTSFQPKSSAMIITIFGFFCTSHMLNNIQELNKRLGNNDLKFFIVLSFFFHIKLNTSAKNPLLFCLFLNSFNITEPRYRVIFFKYDETSRLSLGYLLNATELDALIHQSSIVISILLLIIYEYLSTSTTLQFNIDRHRNVL